MTSSQLKTCAFVCLIACPILLFVAWERYQANANNVNAANALMESTPLGGMMKEMTGGELTPAVPTATKYAGLFGVVAGIAGAVMLVMANKSTSAAPPGKEE